MNRRISVGLKLVQVCGATGKLECTVIGQYSVTTVIFEESWKNTGNETIYCKYTTLKWGTLKIFAQLPHSHQ